MANFLKGNVLNQISKAGSALIDQKLGGGTSTEQASEQWSSQHGHGKKRALFIGVNYFGTKAELKGTLIIDLLIII